MKREKQNVFPGSSHYCGLVGQESDWYTKTPQDNYERIHFFFFYSTALFTSDSLPSVKKINIDTAAINLPNMC